MSLIVTGIILVLVSGFIFSLTFGYKPKLIEKSILLPIIKGSIFVRVMMFLIFATGLMRIFLGIME